MADLATRFAPYKERWDKLSLSIRLAIVTAAVVLVGGIAFGALWDSTPKKAVLFSNLTEDDAAHIAERLRAANIPFDLDDTGTTLLVPEKQVHETRLMLASEGLPNGGGVGFEVFDEQRFGESEFSEQVKYHRALEGELARTISHLSGVKRARVHLVMPTRSLFASSEQDASASVVVHLAPGFRMREDQIKGIVHLVASSVRGLDPEHVTLVDGDGKRLGGGGDSDGEQASDADGYRREIEKGKEKAVQQLLDTTLGAGKSMVRVSAAVSFTREEVTEEHYDPSTVATRSFQINEERDGASDKTVSGVPGAPSNLPGGEVATAGEVGKNGLTRRSETRNFEVSKVMRRAVEPIGRVTGMQVAVVADGKWVGPVGKQKFEPLPQDQLDRIQHLVASAVGIDEKRGDKVVVECVPFAPVAVSDEHVSIIDHYVGPYMELIQLGGALILIIIVMLTLRKLLKGITGQQQHAVTQLSPAASIAALGAGIAAGQPAELSPGITDLLKIPERTLAANAARDDTLEQVRVLASDLASREPEAAARVIRGWLAEGN